MNKHFLELIRTNWKLYTFVFAFSLLVHLALFIKVGPCPSTDYQVRYAPQAMQIVQWLKGSGGVPHIHGYDIFHLTYTMLVSFFTFFFEQKSLVALIIFQTLVSFPLFLLILYISLNSYTSKLAAVLFTCLSFLFFDNIHWTTWAVPDSVFRILFVVLYYMLLKLYFERRYRHFLIALVMASVLLVLTRIDAIILLSPVYCLGTKVILSHWQRTRIPVLLLAVAFLLLELFFIKDIANAVGVILDLYWEGFVVLGIDKPIPGLTTIGVFDYQQANNLAYVLGRAAKLFLLRLYYFLNIFPPLFSKNHQIYYAAHMGLFYLFVVVALIRVWVTKDLYFSMYFFVYVATLILHGLTFVDSSMRIAYTAQLLLILFAGYGFDYLQVVYRDKKVH